MAKDHEIRLILSDKAKRELETAIAIKVAVDAHLGAGDEVGLLILIALNQGKESARIELKSEPEKAKPAKKAHK